jgi:hypothetical protein
MARISAFRSDGARCVLPAVRRNPRRQHHAGDRIGRGGVLRSHADPHGRRSLAAPAGGAPRQVAERDVVVGVFDPDYVWHDLAQVCQAPGDGEQLLDTLLGGTVQDRAERMAGLGIPLDVATSIAPAQQPAPVHRWIQALSRPCLRRPRRGAAAPTSATRPARRRSIRWRSRNRTRSPRPVRPAARRWRRRCPQSRCRPR